uniref:Uncharacterized protein n=1 Tax=Knipowitschia caucasica TaxID=637954 RepID=A0AAV2J8I9_KNICA
MAGKDASLSFITGDFRETELTDDVSNVSPLQLVALYEWLSFYQRQYQHVGFLIGRMEWFNRTSLVLYKKWWSGARMGWCPSAAVFSWVQHCPMCLR